MVEYNFSVTTNLCYIFNNKNEVLLIMKKRGVGVGKWNGPGGKVEPGETIEQSVIREVEEETGLKIKNVKQCGILEFIAPQKPAIESRCYIFTTTDYEGKLIETEECYGRWFLKNQMPVEQMWAADKLWLPKLISGQLVNFRFYYDKNEVLEKTEEFTP